MGNLSKNTVNTLSICLLSYNERPPLFPHLSLIPFAVAAMCVWFCQLQQSYKQTFLAEEKSVQNMQHVIEDRKTQKKQIWCTVDNVDKL